MALGVEHPPRTDSPVEGDGFEPSVPGEGSYAHGTGPFDRYGVSLQPHGADSFARGTDGSNPFPSATAGSVSGVYSAAVRCRIGGPAW
jgi:hypothetical protein